MRRIRQWLAIGIVVAFSAVLLPQPAGAGWTRAVSTLEIESEEIRVCTDTIEVRTFYDWVGNWSGTDEINSLYPSLDELGFYFTRADAISESSPLAVLQTEMRQTSLNADGAEWEGQNAIPTPLKPDGERFKNGDVVWVQVNTGPSAPIDAAALTIGGEARFDCPPDHAELDAEFLFGGPAVRVRSGLPAILYFDATGINVRSFKVMADNGKIAPVRHLVTINDTAFVFLKPRRAGVKCSSDSLILTGFTSDGRPVSDVLPVVPFPCPFPG